MEKARYCIRCGGLLEERRIEGKRRLVCQSCGRVHYENPFPTVDVIIERGGGVVLVKRKNPPYGWALPGGFVDYGESLEDAAVREVKEETNLEIEDLRQFHTYSNPARDPRCHTISTVFVGRGKGRMKPSDDAKEVRVFREEEIPSDLAFDHRKILEDYFNEKEAFASSSELKIALYPGSFDPVTNGHLDILKRSLSLFDKIVVAVSDNPLKNFLFSTEERVQMIKEAIDDLESVEVESFRGLLVNYARKKGARFIIRGLRAISDFEYEFQMDLMNRKLNSEIQTVYLMTDAKYSYLSSSIVKEIARFGGCTKGLVPEVVERKLLERFKEGWNAN